MILVKNINQYTSSYSTCPWNKWDKKSTYKTIRNTHLPETWGLRGFRSNGI